MSKYNWVAEAAGCFVTLDLGLQEGKGGLRRRRAASKNVKMAEVARGARVFLRVRAHARVPRQLDDGLEPSSCEGESVRQVFTQDPGLRYPPDT